MASVVSLPATQTEVAHIAQALRARDRQELQAVHGDDVDVLACLRRAISVSEQAFTAWAPDGEPIALYGVAAVSLIGGLGCPWFLATDRAQSYPRDIVVVGKQSVQDWSQRYDQLFNYVDARNLRSIRWLKRIGFDVFPPLPYGVQGRPFHRFERCT